MLRIIYLVLRVLFHIPSYIYQIKQRKNHKEKYSLNERILWTRDFLRSINKKARVDLKIVGQENIPSDTWVMTPNHQGLFDVLALFEAVDEPFKIVYKKELDDTPLVKDVLNFMEYPAIDRTNLRQSMKVIRQMTNEIKEGMNYVIFPEGTRSKEGNKLGEFKGGSFKSAIDAKAPIVPVAMIDCFKVLDSNSIKKVHCELHILKPLYYEDYKEMKSSEIAEYVKKQIEDCINAN